MKISSIVSVPVLNVARAIIDGSSYQKGTSEELASSMLQNGWDETSHIGIRVPTEDELVIVEDYLVLERERLANLEGQELAYNLTISHDEDYKAKKVKVTNAMLSTEFNNTYFDKSGKLKSLAKVKVTVFGHHRTHMILVANSARANNGLTRIEPKTLEHTYNGEQEWKDACIKENAQRERAATGINTLDVLRQAKSLMSNGYTESKHRKDLGNKKVGLIQQAWRFLKLNNSHPDLNLYERALLPESNKNRIAYKSLNKESLQKLLTTNDDGESASSEQVLVYVNEPLKKTNKPLTGSDLKAIRENAPCKMLKVLLNDIATGKRDTLTALNNNSTLLNALTVPSEPLSIKESIDLLHGAIEVLTAKQAELKG